jgi:hypothetical protein
MAMSRAKEQGGGRVEVYAGADGPGDAPVTAPPGTTGAPGVPPRGPGEPAASGMPGQPQTAAR